MLLSITIILESPRNRCQKFVYFAYPWLYAKRIELQCMTTYITMTCETNEIKYTVETKALKPLKKFRALALPTVILLWENHTFGMIVVHCYVFLSEWYSKTKKNAIYEYSWITRGADGHGGRGAPGVSHSILAKKGMSSESSPAWPQNVTSQIT